MRVVLGQIGGEHDGLTLACTQLPHRRGDFELEQPRAVFQQQMLFVHDEEVAKARTAFVMVIRFHQEIGDAHVERGVTDFGIVADSDHYDRHLRTSRQLPQPLDRLNPIDLAHLEIGENKIGDIASRPLNRLQRAREGLDIDTGVDATDDALKYDAGASLVIDDEDLFRCNGQRCPIDPLSYQVNDVCHNFSSTV